MDATTTTEPGTGTSSGAKDKAQQAAGQAQETMHGAKDQAQEKLQEATGQAREQAMKLGDQARGRAREQVDHRSTMIGERAGSTAEDLRSVSESLREQGKDQPAQLAEQVADRVDRLGDYLRDADADRLLGDVERAARQRPWAVIAGGLAAGFVASRVLRASSSDRYHASQGGSSAEGFRPIGTPASQPLAPSPLDHLAGDVQRSAGTMPQPGAAPQQGVHETSNRDRENGIGGGHGLS